MLLKTPETYYAALTKLANKFSHGIITSFGVFASIGFDGDISHKYPSKEKEFLDAVQDHPDLSLVIGVHGYYSAFPEHLSPGHCRHCIAAYTRRTLRIDKHREFFPNLNWYMLQSLHSKVAAFWDDDRAIAIIGSRNFTNSPNLEAAIMISGTEAYDLKDYAIELRDQANKVELDHLMNFLVEETGSDYCLKMVCGEA